MLDAMNILVLSWNAVSTETIVKRSRKAGISSSSQELVQTVGDDLVKELNKGPSNLWEIDSTEYEMASDKLLRLEDNLCTNAEHPITDDEILSFLCRTQILVKMITTLCRKTMDHHANQKQKS